MRRIKKILKEEKTFTLYQGLMRVGHLDIISASEVADFVRAMPGVTRVSAIESNEDTHTVVLKVKVLTSHPAQQVYDKLRQDTFRLVPNIKKVDVAHKTVEQVSR